MTPRSPRRLSVTIAALLTVCLVAVGGSAHAATAKKATTKKAATGTKASATPVVTPLNPCPPVKSTMVAAMKNTKYRAAIKVYETPDDTKDPKWTLGVGIESAGAIVFTVNGQEGEWLNVDVPVRPNGSIGWIKAAEVSTYTHPFYMVLELSKRLLTVCNSGKIILQEKAGIGDPSKGVTPLGTFYTLDLIKPKGGPNGAYGPFAFGLSGYSETIFDFAGGDGRLGIHGTNRPDLLGQPVSHGCIRVSNAAITKMAKTLYLGVPVKITN